MAATKKSSRKAPKKATRKASKKAPAKRGTTRSLYREESPVLLGALRSLREGAGLTQVALSQRMKRSQHFVSSIERGATRIDPVQLLDWCLACGVSLSVWAKEAEKGLKERGF
jgi:ribosome-binding protein aMBF1 (putative translation factor)